jgi:adenylate kinase
MAAGALLPDQIVLDIIAARFDEADAKTGFIMDGFPRTLLQAEGFDVLLATRRLALDKVLELRVDESALIDRIATRAKEAAACGELDDNPEVLSRRLQAYVKETAHHLSSISPRRVCCRVSMACSRSRRSRISRAKRSGRDRGRQG